MVVGVLWCPFPLRPPQEEKAAGSQKDEPPIGDRVLQNGGMDLGESFRRELLLGVFAETGAEGRLTTSPPATSIC